MKKSNYFFYFLIKILSLPFYLIGFIIPKNDKIWIFGSWKGEKYNDNPKALFEYIKKEKKDIRAVWLTKNDTILDILKEKGYEVYKTNSIKGIYCALISGVVILCSAISDLGVYSFLFPWKKKIIQLWHGTPLKRLDISDRVFSVGERMLSSLFVKYLGRPFDIIISACDLNKKIYSKTFNIPVEMVKITGQPRNDKIFIREKQKSSGKKIIYLPTWREYDTNLDLFEQFGFDAVRVDGALEKMGAELFLKFHMNESEKNKYFIQIIKHAKRIKLLEIDDIYDVLGAMNVLITDYSSVYFDYLLLDRPIIFAPFDLEIYQKKRGLYYDYETVIPGPKARNWTDVMTYVEQAITNDTFREARKIVNKNFNYWQDGKSSERVYEEIVKIINKK
ncbi:MAG TPA: CDP-glycerol glycerophosphotransferase family protein [Candidatus Paceibacterota bacterium]|nr:CDP-glycerol glycerophosphotransferase family protein [Candidatus Paceibacterota bacterium]